MAFYLQTLAVPTIVRGIVYVVVFVQPLMAVIVCVTGIFDLWIDFRRIKPPHSTGARPGEKISVSGAEANRVK